MIKCLVIRKNKLFIHSGFLNERQLCHSNIVDGCHENIGKRLTSL